MAPKTSHPRRTRTGCITCRIRRIKCDETKPSCQRCTSTGRPCDGYLLPTTASPSSALSSRALASAVRTLHILGPASRVFSPALPTHESSCFDFFRVCTASMTGGGFWQGQVLQLAHCEPAIWRGIVAIGALHRRWEVSGRDSFQVKEFTKEALKNYWRAISLGSKHQTKDKRVLVVLSVVLAAAANMSGRWGDSLVHIRSGMKLLMEGGDMKGMENVALTLGRLDFQAMVFNSSGDEYQYVEGDGRIPGWFRDESKMARVGDSGMKDLTEGAIVLFGIMRYYFTVLAAAGKGAFPIEEIGNVYFRVVEETDKWQMEFERLIAEMELTRLRTEEERTRMANSVLGLRLYHTTFLLLLRAGVAGPEGRWDAHQDIFEMIIALAEEQERKTKSPLPLFLSLEPGLVMPLFLVAIRCRHPIVRRKALNLLRGMNRHEGMWNSIGVLVVAEQVVLAEEEYLPFYLPLVLENLDSIRPPQLELYGWPMVPEEMRISRNACLVEAEKNQIELFLFRNLPDGSGEYLAKEVILRF
ncbi:hypothetical protein QBC38DRAFT_487172 [Podospora fimiseda]|uniref:Zn(2)-C6 fungal-type domain-containing protein n=1 Tax=Podospora fimiseda TaxID=252190 RepID=A0AAN7BHT7_9PEZI|nr:hypothetical protein QBC38DRAFT_487172 [Podospora fimiseda]